MLATNTDDHNKYTLYIWNFFPPSYKMARNNFLQHSVKSFFRV